MSETELLHAFRKERSEEAFAELVRRYAGLVYSVAHRRLPNTALAEDITQLVFIRFAKAPPKVHSAGELAAWLHRTTLNVTIDTWRSETRRRNREQEAAVMQPETNTTTHAFWDEISPSLDEAIDQLNDDDRQAILLRFFKAKPMRDVGTALGVSEAAAKMRVGRAVDKLRTQLGASAAATTAVVLGGVLAERSVEATPVQLVSRLAAMKLPVVAGAVGKGALLHSLSQISRVKLAAGAVGLAVVAISLVHFARSSAPVTQATTQTSNDIAMTTTRSAQPARQFSPVQADLPMNAPKGVKIQFHVLDAETGTGLAGTKIKFIYFGTGGQGESHYTMTDDKGGAAITEPDDSSKRWGPNVFVTAEGHVPKAVSFRTTPPVDYTIRLDSAATVSGLIVDEQGMPVPGVTIYLQNPGSVPGQMENIDFQTCPVTNHEDGSWSCSYIPKSMNELSLTLNKPGYATTAIAWLVNQAGLNDLTLVIDRGHTITGKITDDQGNLITNAKVKVLYSSRTKAPSTHTDESGAFVLTGIRGDAVTTLQGYVKSLVETNDSGAAILHPMSVVETNDRKGAVLHGVEIQGPLEVDLAVQAEGFASQMKTVALSTATNATDFVLAAGNTFRGQVVDEAGNPISNAVVQTDDDLNTSPQVWKSFDWTARTDSNGWFQWNSAPTQRVCYWFEADGYEPIRGMALAADGSEHRIVLKIKQ